MARAPPGGWRAKLATRAERRRAQFVGLQGGGHRVRVRRDELQVHSIFRLCISVRSEDQRSAEPAREFFDAIVRRARGSVHDAPSDLCCTRTPWGRSDTLAASFDAASKACRPGVASQDATKGRSGDCGFSGQSRPPPTRPQRTRYPCIAGARALYSGVPVPVPETSLEERSMRSWLSRFSPRTCRRMKGLLPGVLKITDAID